MEIHTFVYFFIHSCKNQIALFLPARYFVQAQEYTGAMLTAWVSVAQTEGTSKMASPIPIGAISQQSSLL